VKDTQVDVENIGCHGKNNACEDTCQRLFLTAQARREIGSAQATQNALIMILINSIVNLLSEQRKQVFQVEGGPQRGQIHHKRILDNVIRREPEAARAAMRSHLQQVREDVSGFSHSKSQ